MAENAVLNQLCVCVCVCAALWPDARDSSFSHLFGGEPSVCHIHIIYAMEIFSHKTSRPHMLTACISIHQKLIHRLGAFGSYLRCAFYHIR